MSIEIPSTDLIVFWNPVVSSCPLIQYKITCSILNIKSYLHFFKGGDEIYVDDSVKCERKFLNFFSGVHWNREIA